MYTAVIPVRKGSRRLPGKNTAPFCDSNLLVYKINQLKKVPQITKIYVTSDSDEMLEMGRENGVFTHKRGFEYCDEKTKSFGEVVAHVCDNVEGENIIWATCPSPLVEPHHYVEAIELYQDGLLEGFDSLMSVEEFKRYIWTKEGPLNYELGTKHVPSQELESLFRVTDGVLIAPRTKMVEWQYFHGTNPYMYKMDKKSSIDIDDIYDLECARTWLSV
jgi:N-acylneuraminate cytidylyltransferase